MSAQIHVMLLHTAEIIVLTVSEMLIFFNPSLELGMEFPVISEDHLHVLCSCKEASSQL